MNKITNVTAKVDANSVNTDNKIRDRMLRGKDFFDIIHNPFLFWGRQI